MSKIKNKIEEFKGQTKSEKFMNIFILFVVLLGFIMGAIYTFNLMDSTPASPKDFEPLYEQKKLLESDFSSVWNMDNVEINLSADSKKVILTSSECNLVLGFDEHFKIISTEEVDNYTTIYFVIVISVLIGLLGSIATLIMLLVFALFVLLICWLFDKLLNTNKVSNNQKSESQE